MSVIHTMNGENIVNVDLAVEVGKNLKRIRQRKRLRQEDVGARMKATKSFVSSVENGKRDIQLSTIGKFCHALGIAPATLFRFRLDEDDVAESETKNVTDVTTSV